jgi:hypothetical protein
MSETSAAARLPSEILERIFSEMEPSRKLYSCALVCKKFNQLATLSLYTTVHLEHEDAAVLFSETVCALKPMLTKYTKELWIPNLDDPPIIIARILLCPWPRLRVLAVRKFIEKWWLPARSLPFLPQLLHLEVTGCTLPKFMEKSYNTLRHLKLGHCGQIQQGSTLPCFPNLRSLELRHVKLKQAEPDGMLSAIIAACPRVQRLEYSSETYGEIRESNDFWILLDALSENLKFLSFTESMVNLNPRNLRSIESLPKLESLELNITGEFLYPFSFPETISQLAMEVQHMRAEHLTAFLSDLGQGLILPFIDSVPVVDIREILGDAESRAICKKEAKSALNNLKARGIPRAKAGFWSEYYSVWKV